jgi:hypothetical protein
MAIATHPEVQASEPNAHGYRAFHLGEYQFSRDLAEGTVDGHPCLDVRGDDDRRCGAAPPGPLHLLRRHREAGGGGEPRAGDPRSGDRARLRVGRDRREAAAAAPLHRQRVFVDRLDFVTSGAEGITAVITDLGVLGRDRASGELVLTALHPGVGVDEVRAATGWPLRVADGLGVSTPPSPGELDTLRALVARGEFAA